jgi:hypothetical protein
MKSRKICTSASVSITRQLGGSDRERFCASESDKGHYGTDSIRHQDLFRVKSVCAFGPVFRLLKLGFKSVCAFGPVFTLL